MWSRTLSRISDSFRSAQHRISSVHLSLHTCTIAGRYDSASAPIVCSSIPVAHPSSGAAGHHSSSAVAASIKSDAEQPTPGSRSTQRLCSPCALQPSAVDKWSCDASGRKPPSSLTRRTTDTTRNRRDVRPIDPPGEQPSWHGRCRCS